MWLLRLELYELVIYCTWSFGAAESRLQTRKRTLETQKNVLLLYQLKVCEQFLFSLSSNPSTSGHALQGSYRLQASAESLPRPKIGVRPVPVYKLCISALYKLIDAQFSSVQSLSRVQLFVTP